MEMHYSYKSNEVPPFIKAVVEHNKAVQMYLRGELTREDLIEKGITFEKVF